MQLSTTMALQRCTSRTYTVHCGLKETRARFQQRRQFNGARLVLYNRHRIMAEHVTNSIQAMLKFCLRFDGKYNAQF